MQHANTGGLYVGKMTARTTWMIACLVLIWGVSWSIYKAAMPFTPPILFAGTRTFFGGLLLAIFILGTRHRIRWRENWLRYCISALLNTVLFYGIQTIGLNYLPGGLFSVLIYFQPVLIGLFSWMWLQESMSALKIIGLLTGFVGILTISAKGLTGEISILGVALAIISAILWALGVVYVKKESDKVDSLWMIVMQFVIGGAVLLGIGSGVESWASIEWSQHYYWIGLLFGSTLGIPIAFVIYFGLLKAGDASKIASFTFLVPLIAVLIGTIFMNEPFTLSLLIGLILIVCSIWLVNATGQKHASTSAEQISSTRM